MRKICRYDQNHWLMQDKDKNLLLLNEQTNMVFDLQSFIQPERSKREDLNFKQLADEFYNSYVTKDLLTNWEEENGALKILDKFAEWLDSRCGALNTAVTS